MNRVTCTFPGHGGPVPPRERVGRAAADDVGHGFRFSLASREHSQRLRQTMSDPSPGDEPELRSSAASSAADVDELLAAESHQRVHAVRERVGVDVGVIGACVKVRKGMGVPSGGARAIPLGHFECLDGTRTRRFRPIQTLRRVRERAHAERCSGDRRLDRQLRHHVAHLRLIDPEVEHERDQQPGLHRRREDDAQPGECRVETDAHQEGLPGEEGGDRAACDSGSDEPEPGTPRARAAQAPEPVDPVAGSQDHARLHDPVHEADVLVLGEERKAIDERREDTAQRQPDE